MAILKLTRQDGTGRRARTRADSLPVARPALRVLQGEIAACTICPSMKPWRRFGPDAYGTHSTGFLLVGEAPGYVSWRKRRRFTGPAGMLVRRALRQVGHGRYRDLEDLFYMTDVVKCHPAPVANPASNRSPSRAEVAACSDYLVQELAVLRPSVILAFGKLAAVQAAHALQASVWAGASKAALITFPHPSPRNQVTIRKHYASMQEFEDAIAETFRRLIARLEQSPLASRSLWSVQSVTSVQSVPSDQTD